MDLIQLITIIGIFIYIYIFSIGASYRPWLQSFINISSRVQFRMKDGTVDDAHESQSFAVFVDKSSVIDLTELNAFIFFSPWNFNRCGCKLAVGQNWNHQNTQFITPIFKSLEKKNPNEDVLSVGVWQTATRKPKNITRNTIIIIMKKKKLNILCNFAQILNSNFCLIYAQHYNIHNTFCMVTK